MKPIGALLLLASIALPAQVPALDPAGLAQILKSGKWTVIEKTDFLAALAKAGLK
jgi:hypothetical protein